MTFANRHIGPDHVELPVLLEAVGVSSLDELIEKAVPESILLSEPLALPPARSETEALADLADLAGRNEVFTSLIGMGYYNTLTPGVITRNVLENPAWYTAYTPYQPEISQGRLEALINFQTMVMDLTGTDLTNASLLDEGTAAAEAMTLCHRATKAKNDVFFVDRDCHPQTIDVVRTRAEPLGIKVMVGDPRADLDGTEVFGLLVQYPASSGEIHDDRALFEQIHAQGGLVTVATDLLALALLTPPGELGADVVVGTTQRFGVPLGFGGPHAAFLATTEKHKRTIPGRIVGMSVDEAGRPAARLALQTREQHIRREKATSNICTAQVLLAVIAGMYAVYHGPEGITEIARRVHRRTAGLAAGLGAEGIEVTTKHFFDTITVKVPGRAEAVLAAALAAEINLRPIDADHVGISLDETTTAATVAAVLGSFGIVGVSEADVEGLEEAATDAIPTALARTSEFLTHPIFQTNHSETEMLRYLRRLADKDIALDRSMIPLGSCTMKLNATSEMVPITWPEFGAVHPFAPLAQSAGYLELFSDLEAWLAECTGYDAVSLQPNAGSQGELAGLLAIRRYHESRGENARDICLIPSSAHGTNAASAVMAGMRVIVVACDDEGNVDVADLTAKATEHSDSLAAAMITYPSTHGVYETAVGEICQIMHDNGGQVYVDGANLNALVGVAKPGKFGADVSHLNLHKTFCIPHGGGGPGVGPIGVGAHLAPFLPTSSVVPEAGPENAADVVSAAPWGSAGILPIPWMYLAMMGADGLRRATAMAILNANYLALKIGPHFPVLYRGEGGFVAHECIIDIRPITEATGVTVDDVAKRLIDYGFHAPTMSFPVAGTLMIEPTESEPLAELDRFVDAMVSIKGEIDRVASGEWPEDDNPLRNSPHPAEDLLVAEWTHPYTREEAAYPDPSLRANKYWAPVSRIDGAHGDRNLICSCPTVEELAM